MEVKKNNVVIATFLYDGDGRRVAQTLNGVTTYFVGSYYEEIGSVGTQQHIVTKYYYAGSTRVAMRTDDDATPGTTLNFLLSDHLGSTSLTLNANGNVISELRYKPWGEVRYQSGITPTQYQFTGQYSNVPDFCLMYYGARWYDPYLNRFAQADSIIPGAGNSQAWDRYAYALNNPARYNDPDGHCAVKPGHKCPTNPKINASSITRKISGSILGGFRAYPSQGAVESEPPSSFDDIQSKTRGSGVAGMSESAASIVSDLESYALYWNEIKAIQNSPNNVIVTINYDYLIDNHQWSFNGINVANNSNTPVGLGAVSVTSGVYTNLGEHEDVLYQGAPIIVRPGKQEYINLNQHYQTNDSCSALCQANNPVIVDVVIGHFDFTTTVSYNLPSPTSFLTSTSSSQPFWNPYK